MSKLSLLNNHFSVDSTRYEVEVQMQGLWYVWHQRADLTRAKQMAERTTKQTGHPTRLVVVSENRRIIP
jgi:hypothetical protein